MNTKPPPASARPCNLPEPCPLHPRVLPRPTPEEMTARAKELHEKGSRECPSCGCMCDPGGIGGVCYCDLACDFCANFAAPRPVEKFYILCQSFSGDLALWWRAERRGYTSRLDEAGKYDEPEARSIERIRGTDRAISCETVDAVAVRVVPVGLVSPVGPS